MESEIFSGISKNKVYGMDDLSERPQIRKNLSVVLLQKKDLQISVAKNRIKKQMKNMLRKLGKSENRNE
ncbi:hypothetical protein [Nitrosopumilus sp.]|uniref:hypothetical protein n=1 Tax=Nitrosopumilus sp. TaxID=2024843 RepID=UPI003450A5DF